MAVILSEDLEQYIGLNETAYEIWQLIGSPTRFSNLINKLLASYEVDEATCMEHTKNILSSLLEKKLITLHKSD